MVDYLISATIGIGDTTSQHSSVQLPLERGGFEEILSAVSDMSGVGVIHFRSEEEKSLSQTYFGTGTRRECRMTPGEPGVVTDIWNWSGRFVAREDPDRTGPQILQKQVTHVWRHADRASGSRTCTPAEPLLAQTVDPSILRVIYPVKVTADLVVFHTEIVDGSKGPPISRSVSRREESVTDVSTVGNAPIGISHVEARVPGTVAPERTFEEIGTNASESPAVVLPASKHGMHTTLSNQSIPLASQADGIQQAASIYSSTTKASGGTIENIASFEVSTVRDNPSPPEPYAKGSHPYVRTALPPGLDQGLAAASGLGPIPDQNGARAMMPESREHGLPDLQSPDRSLMDFGAPNQDRLNRSTQPFQPVRTLSRNLVFGGFSGPDFAPHSRQTSVSATESETKEEGRHDERLTAVMSPPAVVSVLEQPSTSWGFSVRPSPAALLGHNRIGPVPEKNSTGSRMTLSQADWDDEPGRSARPVSPEIPHDEPHGPQRHLSAEPDPIMHILTDTPISVRATMGQKLTSEIFVTEDPAVKVVGGKLVLRNDDTPTIIQTSVEHLPPFEHGSARLVPNEHALDASPRKIHGQTMDYSELISRPETVNAASHFVQLARAIGASARSADGSHRMSLNLQPESLGRVEIRITHSMTAGDQIHIAVARPETLTLLRADTAALNQALDAAGLALTQRDIVLQLATPDTTASDRNMDTFDRPSSGEDSRQSFTGHRGHTGPNRNDNPDAQADRPALVRTWPGSHKTGIDITA